MANLNLTSRAIADLFRDYGIDPSQFIGDTLDYAHRVEATRGGVRAAGVPHQEVEGGQVEHLTPYSSNVAAVRYDPYNDVLYLLFDNHREKTGVRLYVYRDLIAHGFDSTAIFAEVASAPSPGAVVWDRVRRAGAPFNKL